jgi:hypothetical protein
MHAFWRHWARVIMHVTTISGEIRSTSADRSGNLVATVFDFFTHFCNSKKLPKNISIFSPFQKGAYPQKAPFLFCPTIVGQKQKVLTPKTLAYCQHWQLLGIIVV